LNTPATADEGESLILIATEPYKQLDSITPAIDLCLSIKFARTTILDRFETDPSTASFTGCSFTAAQ
jgi:hypothetical protein